MKQINVEKLSSNSLVKSDGIWKTEKIKKVSYTKNGHKLIKPHEEKSFWFEHRLACLNTILSNYPIQDVLDIGGGNGIFSKLLQSTNTQTCLLEPSIDGALAARRNGVEHIINASLFDVNFKNACFKSVVLLDVLEHIEDDNKFINEINRILEVNGRLILTVPAYQFLFSKFDDEVGHYRRYSLPVLCDILVRSGFGIEYKSYFFSFLPLPIFIKRVLLKTKMKEENQKSVGHINKSGLLGKILKMALWPEKVIMKYKIKIPFGSSCVIVANKIAI